MSFNGLKRGLDFSVALLKDELFLEYCKIRLGERAYNRRFSKNKVFPTVNLVSEVILGPDMMSLLPTGIKDIVSKYISNRSILPMMLAYMRAKGLGLIE